MEMDRNISKNIKTREAIMSNSYCTVDKRTNKVIEAGLEDGDGDETDLTELSTKLGQFLADKITIDSGENIYNKNIIPLVAEVVNQSLPDLLKSKDLANLMLYMPSIRFSLIMATTLGFCLHKIMKDKNLKIISSERELTPEEQKNIEINKIIYQVDMAALISGISPKDTLREMYKSGIINDADLEMLNVKKEDILEEREDNDDRLPD